MLSIGSLFNFFANNIHTYLKQHKPPSTHTHTRQIKIFIVHLFNMHRVFDFKIFIVFVKTSKIKKNTTLS